MPHTANGWNANGTYDALKNLIDYVVNEYNVDKDRISICGYSHGAFTWGMVAKYPNLFSAASPVSGGGTASNDRYGYSWNVSDYATTPIYAMAGSEETYWCNSMGAACQEIKGAGYWAEFEPVTLEDRPSVHENMGRALCRQNIIKWLLAQKKGERVIGIEEAQTYTFSDEENNQVKATDEDEDTDETVIKKFRPLNVETGFVKEVLDTKNLKVQGYVHIPENPTTDMPMLVSIHGMGTDFAGVDAVLGEALAQKFIDEGKSDEDKKKNEEWRNEVGNFILVLPHASSGGSTGLIEFIDYIAEKYHANKSKISACGSSLGVQKLYSIMGENPGYFSAAVAISGSQGYAADWAGVAQTPVRNYVGGSERSDEKIAMQTYTSIINNCGGDASLEVIEFATHTPREDIYGVWHPGVGDVVLSDTEVILWLLYQKSDLKFRYKPYDEFKELVDSNSLEALRCFSYREDTNRIYFATYRFTTTGGYKMKENSVSFKQYSQIGNMPFNFLFSLLQTTGNPRYVMAVANLMLEETNIEIMVQDQLSTTTTVQEMASANKTIVYRYSNYNMGSSSSIGYSFPTDPTEKNTYIRKNNTAIVFVRKAKTWCLDFEQIAEKNAESRSSQQIFDDDYTDEDFAGLGYDTRIEGPYTEQQIVGTSNNQSTEKSDKPKYNIIYTTTETYVSNGKLMHSSTTSIYNYTWDINLLKKELNYERFLGLWKNDIGKYYLGSLYDPNGKEIAYNLPNGEGKLYPAQSISSTEAQEDIDILLELLSRHSDTQLHEQVMMYFWNVYKNTNKYDVNVEDLLDLFKTPTFTKFGENRNKLPVNGTNLTKEQFVECVQNNTPGSYRTICRNYL